MKPVQKVFEYLKDARSSNRDEEQSEPLRLGIAQILDEGPVKSRSRRAIQALDEDRRGAYEEATANRNAEKNRAAQNDAEPGSLPVP